MIRYRCMLVFIRDCHYVLCQTFQSWKVKFIQIRINSDIPNLAWQKFRHFLEYGRWSFICTFLPLCRQIDFEHVAAALSAGFDPGRGAACPTGRPAGLDTRGAQVYAQRLRGVMARTSDFQIGGSGSNPDCAAARFWHSVEYEFCSDKNIT